MNKSQASFIGACIGLVLLTFLIVNFGGYQVPGYVTGPIGLFASFLVGAVVAIMSFRNSPYERLQEAHAEARKQYRKPDPYRLGYDEANHHSQMTLSRKEILFQCNRSANKFSPADSKEFMRGANDFIRQYFADPVDIEV